MEGLLSASNEISACELSAAKILKKLIKTESPAIVQENLNLILLLAANCRSHILDHVQQYFGEEYTKENKSAKENNDKGDTFILKADDVKVEVITDMNEPESEGEEMNTNDDINPLENQHTVGSVSIGHNHSPLQEDNDVPATSSYDNYDEYDDNIQDDENSEADPMYVGEGTSKQSKISGELEELICYICRRRFKTEDGLKVHIDTFDHNKYSCDQCGKTFPKKNKLERHKITHTDERPFPCDICDKAYQSSYRLTQHKLIKHGIKKKTFVCQFCDKEYNCEQNLTLHTQKVHTNNGKQKAHSCDKCDKSFTKSTALIYHKKVHIKVDEAEFNCETCVKSFRNQRRLEFHLRKTHGFVKEKNILISKNILSCEQCEMKFNSHNNLMNHILKHALERQTVDQEIRDPT